MEIFLLGTITDWQLLICKGMVYLCGLHRKNHIPKKKIIPRRKFEVAKWKKYFEKKLGLIGNGFSRSMYDILMRNNDLFVRCKKRMLLDQNLYMWVFLKLPIT